MKFTTSLFLVIAALASSTPSQASIELLEVGGNIARVFSIKQGSLCVEAEVLTPDGTVEIANLCKKITTDGEGNFSTYMPLQVPQYKNIGQSEVLNAVFNLKIDGHKLAGSIVSKRRKVDENVDLFDKRRVQRTEIIVQFLYPRSRYVCTDHAWSFAFGPSCKTIYE